MGRQTSIPYLFNNAFLCNIEDKLVYHYLMVLVIRLKVKNSLTVILNVNCYKKYLYFHHNYR